MNVTALNHDQQGSKTHAPYRKELFATANDRHISFLDEAVPLRGASHADVVRYSVEVPLRYAECYGVLGDGRKVPLADKRLFVAWSRRESLCSLLFEARGMRIETRIDPSDQSACDAPGNIAGIDIQSIRTDSDARPRNLNIRGRQFIARDGAVFG